MSFVGIRYGRYGGRRRQRVLARKNWRLQVIDRRQVPREEVARNKRREAGPDRHRNLIRQGSCVCAYMLRACVRSFVWCLYRAVQG